MRKLIFTLHLYVALIAGVFVVLLGLTGCIMAFEPELDHLLHPHLMYVQPRPRALSLTEIGAAVTKAFPGETPSAYTLSGVPDISTQVTLRRGTVFVNPYTGEVLGVRAPASGFLPFVHQLHLRLSWQVSGDYGKKVMSWAGVVILFLLFTGLYLWWPLKRITIAKNATGRRFWFDLHNAIGIISLVFLLVLTLTGIAIGFDDNIVPAFYKLTRSQPSEAPKTPAPPPDARPITLEQAMEIARSALPGTTPFGINVPGPKGAYLVRSRFPEDRTPGGRSRVIIDQYTGKVLLAEDSRTAPAGTRMVIVNRAIHTGDIFGIPSKAVMSVASLALAAQMLSGLVMWTKRKK